MKKFLPFIIATLSFLAVFFGLACAETDLTDSQNQNTGIDKVPNISFSETVFDFGSVYQGEEVIHAFKFQNAGDATLNISRVQASCGCSRAEASLKEITPGQSGEIEVTFRTAGFKGRQSKNVYVYSNDPLNPTVKLYIKGEVKLEVEVKPRTLMFGDVAKRARITKQIEISQKGEKELLINKVTADKKYLQIDGIEKKEQNGKNVYLVKVTLALDQSAFDSVVNSPASRRYLSDVIEINTNLERQKKILIPTQARILPDITLSPERIIFKTAPGEKKISSVIISSKGDDFEIQKVESTIKYLSAELFTLEKFKKYRIDFSLDKSAPPGSIRGNVIVFTTCPGETELRIPVFGEIIVKPIQIGYFFERGCLDCDHAHSILQSLKVEFPAITIKEYDIGVRENMQLDEELCEICGVPEEKRLIAPAIFIGKDYLAGKGITREKIVELIQKYPDGVSLPLEEAAQRADKAETSIAARFQRFGVFAIIAAGFLDGVNPCAFAAIIFFISYLTILKRKGREILIVGIAFTSAVFITYFLIGIGLFEFLKYLSVLQKFTKFLYAIVAALTLLLGILSFLDFLKCRKGKATESALQLPRFLKNKIHSTIKEQANFKKYVLTAFITGLIISVLELACTGQVYLPTIVYATGISDLRFSAYIYLLLYNLMFITPLIVIFILAYFGATAIDLSDVLGKNMALIKLSLSILFFIFTAFLIILIV